MRIARVSDIQVRDKQWIVASTQGIFTSSNSGISWEGGPILGHSDFTLVRTNAKLITAAGRNFLLTSYDDGGESSKAGCQILGCQWRQATLPQVVSSINDLAVGPDESIWLACREGLYRSKDHGETWQRLETLPIVNLAAVLCDAQSHRILVTGLNSTEVFSSEDEGRSWKRRESGWLLRAITPDKGRLIASTAFDGVVIEQPAAVAAGVSASSAAAGVK